MEWDIDGIKYVPGESCPEDAAQNTKDKWNTMNKIYGTEAGKKVIDEMNTKEAGVFKISSEIGSKKEGADGSYISNRDGSGGTIYLNNDNNNVNLLSHEMFHGYQDMKGHGSSMNVQNEVEAYLFEVLVVGDNSPYRAFAPRNSSSPTSYIEYTSHLLPFMKNEITNENFDTHFNKLVNGFKKYAKANGTGLYNAASETTQSSLIKQFYIK
jgi:hypothetical protein